ncbi:putative acetyltransferase [Azospirillum agricola]|uniref:GNAT family N-acetyltransferase n=1 Tax=Azospirillum agricola TaxID=1720247 RepID=UPI001AE4C2BF|nr:GNAT family N-acetyltransferase [Azospirillum agricola]MBP2227368.1 putative acetyltransferase [Azospirillum agricola]
MTVYGPASPDDFDAIARLSRTGFGVPRDLFDRYAALFGNDTIRSLRGADGRSIAGCAALWGMDQWFGGRPVPAQGVAMVAVEPALRGGGTGSALMRRVLAEGREAGAAVSVLWHSTLPFYRRLGYGRGGVSCGWSAPPAALGAPSAEPGDCIRPADPLDAAPLAALRRALLAGANGLPERNEALWNLALCPDGEPSDVFLLCGADGPEGYVAVTPPKDGLLTVADLCAPTPLALRLARRLLAGYRAQVERVAWQGGPDDPLALLADDAGVRMDGREEWLLRVLDVRRALTARGYPPSVVGSMTFDTNDPLIPDNSGCFHLQVDGGTGVIAERAQDDSAVARIGIAAFSTLFSGHASARALRQAGMLDGEDVVIETLDRLFCGAHPWMNDRF